MGCEPNIPCGTCNECCTLLEAAGLTCDDARIGGTDKIFAISNATCQPYLTDLPIIPPATAPTTIAEAADVEDNLDNNTIVLSGVAPAYTLGANQYPILKKVYENLQPWCSFTLEIDFSGIAYPTTNTGNVIGLPTFTVHNFRHFLQNFPVWFTSAQKIFKAPTVFNLIQSGSVTGNTGPRYEIGDFLETDGTKNFQIFTSTRGYTAIQGLFTGYNYTILANSVLQNSQVHNLGSSSPTTSIYTTGGQSFIRLNINLSNNLVATFGAALLPMKYGSRSIAGLLTLFQSASIVASFYEDPLNAGVYKNGFLIDFHIIGNN